MNKDQELEYYKKIEETLHTLENFLIKNVGEHTEDYRKMFEPKLKKFLKDNGFTNSETFEYCDKSVYMDIILNKDNIMEKIKEKYPEVNLTITIVYDKDDEISLNEGTFTFKNFYIYSNDFDFVHKFVIDKIGEIANELIQEEMEFNQ